MNCSKCGKPTIHVMGTNICRDWRCWDSKPARPAALEAGADPLTSELGAIGVELDVLLTGHSSFLSDALLPKFNGNHPQGAHANAVLSVIIGVSMSVLWHHCQCQIVPGGEQAKMADWFRATVVSQLDGIIRESMMITGQVN